MGKQHFHTRVEDALIWWIPAEGPPELKATNFSLDSMQSFVGGYIELVHPGYLPRLDCGCSLAMMMNEEGWLRKLPINRLASTFYQPPMTRQVLGDVFLVALGPVRKNGADELQMDFFGLPPELNKWFELVAAGHKL